MKTDKKVFTTVEAFEAYLSSLRFNAWRPRFVTMHHTGSPNLAKWKEWQTRAKPVTPQQWLDNLENYYSKELGWNAGPHFFFSPQHYMVLSSPIARGTHAVSFNATSWGVECIGDFDREVPETGLLMHYAEGLAALHLAAGLTPDPYEWNVRGLHFHRDDPRTTKTCPGRNVQKTNMVQMVRSSMLAQTAGDAPNEQVEPVVETKHLIGVVMENDLNLRADASAKSPILASLSKGEKVVITGNAMNGTTKWLQVDVPSLNQSGWLAARYVEQKGD